MPRSGQDGLSNSSSSRQAMRTVASPSARCRHVSCTAPYTRCMSALTLNACRRKWINLRRKAVNRDPVASTASTDVGDDDDMSAVKNDPVLQGHSALNDPDLSGSTAATWAGTGGPDP